MTVEITLIQTMAAGFTTAEWLYIADWVPILTVLLLIAGVVGSLVPGLPGAGLSLTGVLFYWWQSGFTQPGIVLLASLLGLGLLALVTDWFGSAAAATASGASKTTTVIAGIAGVLLLFVAGPIGVLAGVGGTVFLLELRKNGDPSASFRVAVYTTVGMLASAFVQAILTGAMLLIVIIFVI